MLRMVGASLPFSCYAYPCGGFVTRALASLLSYRYTAPVSYHYGECDEVY